MKYLSLLILAFTCYCKAENFTDITNETDKPVQFQCNRWGWVSGLHEVFWKATCTPLEVRTATGKLFSVPTTVRKCSKQKVAVYKYMGEDKKIIFVQCDSQ